VVEDPMLAFWRRGGLTVEAENVRSFGLAAALDE
jgi:hypothetical protein